MRLRPEPGFLGFADDAGAGLRGPALARLAPCLDEPVFADFLAGFALRPRSASPANVPRADPKAAPALAGAPSRTSLRATFRALRFAIAVTATAARASRTSGFFKSSPAFAASVRAWALRPDGCALRDEPVFGLLAERVLVVAISISANGAAPSVQTSSKLCCSLARSNREVVRACKCRQRVAAVRHWQAAAIVR